MEKTSKHKKTLSFKIVGISLPFLFLVILEIFLRLFNYGTNLDLFVPYDVDGEYLRFNRSASQRYFNNSQFAPIGNQELFKRQKDGRTFRIFVLGESTTIGYPYFHNGSFHRWLQYRLMQTYPDSNFEIINLSLTAVNSYTVLGFSKEVVHYEPDAVLIYTGHNEYYGALGVGSTQTLGNNPWVVNTILYLREFKVMQLMNNAYQKLLKSFDNKESKMNVTRMETMVAQRQIPFGSELYDKGENQFKSNMSEILDLFQRFDIPVFLGNLIGNEKDLAPFISVSQEHIASKSFSEHYALGEASLRKHDSLVAYDHFKKANNTFSEHADCNFYLGSLSYAQKKYREAKIYFETAKELDELRFRAPNIFNTIIYDLTVKYSNTHLVDVKKEFENVSHSSIIGKELVVDHVHPNLKGFALMSNAFYKAIEDAELLSMSLKNSEISFDRLLKEMPVSKVDSIAGAYRIHILKESWPYSEQDSKHKITSDTYEQRLAYKLLQKKISWRQVNDSLFAYYNQIGQLEKAIKIAEALVLEFAEDPVFYDKAGMLNAQQQKLGKAIFYITKSFHLRPNFDKARFLLIHHLKMDNPIEAIYYLDYAIANNDASVPELNRIKALTEQVMALKKKMDRSPTDLKIKNEIAQVYVQMENKDGALKYIESVLQIDPNNEDAISLKSFIK